MRFLRIPILLALLIAARPASIDAQVRPDLEWRTITTRHFRVHFSPGLRDLARRTAAHAEYAWERLADELTPPRGTIDIVVADNADYANGYATPFPTNRIVIFARPPVEEMALRSMEDWGKLVVTHELTHIFQLDRVRGVWALGQRMFGRAAPLFPNAYSPSWVLEGMAVHYETKFGGGGRLAGTEFPAHVRAAALESALPPLDGLSLATPFFPGGDRTYIYGSYAVSRADTAKMRDYIDAAAGRLIPWRIDADAKDAFGISFTERWRVWRDSVMRADRGIPKELDAIVDRTRHEFVARFPRYSDDQALIYIADDAKNTTGAYSLPPDGRRHRLGRRNSLDITVRSGDRTVQGELDYADPYSLHGDLFLGNGLSRRRLTRGERLSSPDVHAGSGRIVAVRTDPGTTSVVLVNEREGFVERDVARGTLDRTWAEPRFSRDGERIAAVRWERGGRSSVVVMGLDGKPVRSFAPRSRGPSAPRLPVVSSPVFEPGDTTLLFVSDHTGRAQVYRGDVRTGAYGLVWATRTELNTPDVSPDGKRAAAVELRAGGYHVVEHELPTDVLLALPAEDTLRDPLRPIAPAMSDSISEERPYKALDFMDPSWLLPLVEMTDPGTASYGAMTSSSDPIGRHAYTARVLYEPRRNEFTVDASYAFSGFGVPVLVARTSSDWAHAPIVDTAGTRLGWLGYHEVTASVDAIFERPRVRFSTYAVVGVEASIFDFKSYPSQLMAGLGNEALFDLVRTQTLSTTLGFSTMQRPRLAVSSEDGASGSITHRERFGAGLDYERIPETILAGTVAKSLPLPGYAHHVIAVHAAYGVTGHRATTALSAGGVSGSALEVLPAVVIGASHRTFGVRGFPEGAELGVRAAAVSAEYRMPLTIIGRGLKLAPFFFQKASLTAFADGASAWCDFSVPASFICPAPLPPQQTIASVGGELGLDASLQYDQVYRFRIGFAHPVRGEFLAGRANTLYFTLGSAF